MESLESMAERALRLAQEAIESAQLIRLDHEGHIRECAERYKNLNEKAQDHKEQLGKIRGMLFKAAVGVIVLLLGIAGWQYQQSHSQSKEFQEMVIKAIQGKDRK